MCIPLWRKTYRFKKRMAVSDPLPWAKSTTPCIKHSSASSRFANGRKFKAITDGIRHPKSAEAIVPAPRAFIQTTDHAKRQMVSKLDFKDAFSTDHRDELMRVAMKFLLDYYACLWQCYRQDLYCYTALKELLRPLAFSRAIYRDHFYFAWPSRH